MVMVNYKIHSLFAKPVYQVDNLLNDKLTYYETVIKKYCVTQLGYHYLENIKILDSWFNISKQDDYLQKHIHNGSLISGAFYIKSNVNDVISFYDQIDVTQVPDRNSLISYSEYRLECKPGRLLLFKSSLEHGTPKQKNGEKIVVSFNINI